MSDLERNGSTDATNSRESCFADRLRSLIADGSISAFARKVALSESLIRKYLKGSEPSLTRANQIAQHANVSLEWLATGCGYMYREAEVVDGAALDLARSLVQVSAPVDLHDDEQLPMIISAYQYLRTHKKADGYLDESAGQKFIDHLLEFGLP